MICLMTGFGFEFSCFVTYDGLCWVVSDFSCRFGLLFYCVS